LFEGNPDSTNIKERFAYNHDSATKPGQGHGSGNAPAQNSSSLAAQDTVNQPQTTPIPVSQQTPQETTQSDVPAQLTTGNENAALQSSIPEHSSATDVNGVAHSEQAHPALPNQDAEMSNAS